MKLSLPRALVFTLCMGGIIFFCRVFPFLFFREKKDTRRGEDAHGEEPGRHDGTDETDRKGRSRREVFLNVVEKLVPPAAMTVLAVHTLAGSVKTNLREGLPVLAAAGLTALVHLWKRNPLLSIFGGVAVYMILKRLAGV